MSRAEFELQSADDAVPVEVTVTGEVDASNVVDFTRALRDLPGGRPLVLHLSSVTYFDSAGFSALDHLLADGEIVIVLAPDSFVYRAAELMCLPIHPDAAAARRALTGGG